MSLQPTLFAGQPRAFAIGSQSAITTGERTSEGALATSCRPSPRSGWVCAQRSLMTSTRREEAGDQTAALLWPARLASIDSAEPSAVASTRIAAPDAVRGPVRVQACVDD